MINVYHSTQQSTGIFFGRMIRKDMQRSQVLYFDVTNGFAKYGIDRGLIELIDAPCLEDVISIMRLIEAGKNVVVYIDHFELLKSRETDLIADALTAKLRSELFGILRTLCITTHITCTVSDTEPKIIPIGTRGYFTCNVFGVDFNKELIP